MSFKTWLSFFCGPQKITLRVQCWFGPHWLKWYVQPLANSWNISSKYPIFCDVCKSCRFGTAWEWIKADRISLGWTIPLKRVKQTFGCLFWMILAGSFWPCSHKQEFITKRCGFYTAVKMSLVFWRIALYCETMCEDLSADRLCLPWHTFPWIITLPLCAQPPASELSLFVFVLLSLIVSCFNLLHFQLFEY